MDYIKLTVTLNLQSQTNSWQVEEKENFEIKLFRHTTHTSQFRIKRVLTEELDGTWGLPSEMLGMDGELKSERSERLPC